MAVHVIKFAGPPTGIIPPGLGVHFLDTLNKATYLSIGTSTPADWLLQGGSRALQSVLFLSLWHARKWQHIDV